jgi:hypothetical protein
MSSYPLTFTPSGSMARDGRLAPVTCVACGCRLTPDESETRWYHFHPAGGRDARGCTVACVGIAHDRHGIATTAG